MGVARRLVATVVIGGGVGLLGVLGSSAGVLGGLERQAADLLQPGARSTGDVVVVAIDRATLARDGGTWPWPRQRHAELVDAIGLGDPTAIVYDVFFADVAAGDEELAAALERTPAVVATTLTLRLVRDGPPEVIDELAPNPAIAASARPGHANVRLNERAGVVRSIPWYASGDRGVPAPSMTLVATQLVDGSDAPIIERAGGVQIGTRFVPLDDGELRINWSAELTTDDMISATAVLDGDVSPSTFTGRVVVVGVTEPTLSDLHLTPIDRSGSTPGVLVHANAMNTVLGSAYLADASDTASRSLLIGLALATAGAFVWLRLRWVLVLVGVATISVVGWSSWRFHAAGHVWPILWPWSVLALTAAGGTGWRYVTEHRHRRRAQDLFARYVPDAVVAELADAASLERAAEARDADIAVVFCDLRGFTPIAGSLEPAKVRELLDAYYDYSVAIVHAHGGTVMQFVGDEVFAVFGVPLPAPDRATRAVEVSCALVDRVGELDARLGAMGLPPIRFGIGVNEGPVIVAHVGPKERRQYTVVGDTVNVGSRLCSAAAAGQVVVSSRAAAGATDDRLEPAEVVELKGVAEPMQLHRYTAAGEDATARR